jgi:hypothetical protein
MKLDLRILPIFGMIVILLIDLGCLLHEMNPTEVYGSLWQLSVVHFVFMNFTELKNLIKKESNILIVMVGVPFVGNLHLLKN